MKTILPLAALATLAACGDTEPDPVDTTFEESLAAPVPVADGEGPVPDNEPGTPMDDVEVDYAEGPLADGEAESPTEPGNPEN